MPPKRRRIDWECHLKENDAVIFQSNGNNYIGKVVGTKLRQFGDSYNRVIVLIEPNFVSSSSFSHIYNRQASYSQFYLMPITGANGRIFTEARLAQEQTGGKGTAGTLGATEVYSDCPRCRKSMEAMVAKCLGCGTATPQASSLHFVCWYICDMYIYIYIYM